MDEILALKSYRRLCRVASELKIPQNTTYPVAIHPTMNIQNVMKQQTIYEKNSLLKTRTKQTDGLTDETDKRISE